jgi:glycosyltransferase involved in cell wall biosynthesis
MDCPLVSVVLPAWNREQYIRGAIKSVLRQVHRNLEVVVVDDGSEDGTVDVVRRIADDRVRLITQPNQGAAKARNTGIAAARGEYIAFLDADDLWKPEKLVRQMTLFAQFPELTAVSARAELIDAAGRPMPGFTDTSQSRRYDCARNWHRDLLMHDNIIMTSSMVVKRQALLDVGGFFDERRIVSHDYELWIRLSEGRKFWVSTDVLVSYRMLQESLMHGKTTSKEYMAQLGIISMHRHRYTNLQWRRRLARFYRDWADSAEFQGEVDAPNHLWRALQQYPLNLGVWALGGRMLMRRAIGRAA